ncbi:MAG: alpha/beta fold hydrolase [Micromonosporaceae bacterium]|nr:alpha/beta fold hydrolase [Micromonosporaceae bacterium]
MPAPVRSSETRGAANSRGWPRLAAYGAVFGAAGLALVLPTSAAGAAWYLAGQLLDAEDEHPHPVRIREVSNGLVRLTRTDDLARPIPLGLAWPGGHARLGEIVAVDRGTVLRRVEAVDRGALRAGTRAYASGKLFEGDPSSARSLPYTDVTVRGDLGDFPAWFVPPTHQPTRDTWIIAVHGWKSSREDALRVLPALASTGHPTLVITYRNDQGAPSSADRCHHLGNTEWRDVAAAIRYALDHGATDVILYGWSMGGAIVLNLLRKATESSAVRAIMLDSPVVDWVETLRMHARILKLPRAWLATALWLVQRRLGIRLTDLDHRPCAPDLKVPALIFVDSNDLVVASEPTWEFASMRPDLITVVPTEDCGHCHSWNRDPVHYETAIREFLGSVRQPVA